MPCLPCPTAFVGQCEDELALVLALVSFLGQCPVLAAGRRVRAQGPLGHCCCRPSPDLLRVRQEVAAAAAAVRSPSGLEVHLPTSTGQRRKQGLAQHREGSAPAGTPSFSERYWVSISEAPVFTVLVAGVETRHLGQQPAPSYLSATVTLIPAAWPCGD